MNELSKKTFQLIDEQAKSAPVIAAVGASGAGKTTATAELVNPFAKKLMRSAMGPVQSTKVKREMISVRKKPEEEKEVCSVIRMMEDPDVEPAMRVAREAVTTKLVRAGSSVDLGVGSRDMTDIANEILSPANKIYDIVAFCDEKMHTQLCDEVKKICKPILEGQNNERTLDAEIKMQKDKAAQRGIPFNRDETLRNEIIRRFEEIDVNNLQKIITEIVGYIKTDILNKVREFREAGLDAEEKGNDIWVYIDDSTAKLGGELLKYMSGKDGKDFVVSRLTFIAGMCEKASKIFENTYFPNYDKPFFRIYDMKGLEQGADSIEETLVNVRACLPDQIFVFQRAIDISDYILMFLGKLRQEFKNVPMKMFLSYCDGGLKANLENLLTDFDAVEEGEPGYENFYKESVAEAHRQMVDENNRKYGGRVDEISFVCWKENEVKDLDAVLEQSGIAKLYQPEAFFTTLRDIYWEKRALYKSAGIVEEAVYKAIEISFSETKLDEMVQKLVDKHLEQAPKNYYQQKNFYPHWNTIYKWRARHRVGSGWTSDAKVYDNIRIYIADFLSGFMNKAAICDAMEIRFAIEPSQEQKNRIEEILRQNILADLGQYNGFFNKLKLMLTYEGLEQEFYQTYYRDALELIYRKLSDPAYIKAMMKKALEEYQEIFIAHTFAEQ